MPPGSGLRRGHGHRRFAECADTVRANRWIGVCWGAPGVGKTLSARHYAEHGLVDPYVHTESGSSGRTELLIIDEADRLKTSGLEQVRDYYDRHTMGVILIGMPGIEKLLARYPQLYSRIGLAHEYRPLTPEERTAVLTHRILDTLTPETVEQLQDRAIPVSPKHPPVGVTPTNDRPCAILISRRSSACRQLTFPLPVPSEGLRLSVRE
ncbi:MAG: ATP-binding protein [Arthrobacter sp.]|nr:ATP-binding protein [Arthrobacter sp.]MCU1548322.1 ATP-binding protein [Arthrobacter sp.]